MSAQQAQSTLFGALRVAGHSGGPMHGRCNLSGHVVEYG